MQSGFIKSLCICKQGVLTRSITAKGIKTPKGGDKWCESTVRGILKNEKMD